MTYLKMFPKMGSHYNVCEPFRSTAIQIEECSFALVVPLFMLDNQCDAYTERHIMARELYAHEYILRPRVTRVQ